MHRPHPGWSTIVAGLVAVTLLATPLRGDEPAGLELREWSVWLWDPNQTTLNARTVFPSAMPSAVESTRSRRQDNAADVAPLTVMTFHGKPVDALDVTVKLGTSGTFLAKWPATDNALSNRLRWLNLKLSTEPGSGSLAFVPDSSWFEQARQADALHLERGSRRERFLTYDVDLAISMGLTVSGGPDKYQIANASKFPFKDLLVVAPGPEGRRVGWLDELPGGKPSSPVAAAAQAVGDAVKVAQGQVARRVAGAPGAVVASPAQASAQPKEEPKPTEKVQEVTAELNVSAPMSAEQVAAEVVPAFRQRLLKAGLKDQDIDLLLSIYSKPLFESKEMVLLVRLPQSTLDEWLPIEVDPDSTRIVRVAIVICGKVSPQVQEEIAKLVQQLGDNTYAQREQAEQRLQELGRLAIPALKTATKSNDPERVMRAERLLLLQNERLDAK